MKNRFIAERTILLAAVLSLSAGCNLSVADKKSGTESVDIPGGLTNFGAAEMQYVSGSKVEYVKVSSALPLSVMDASSSAVTGANTVPAGAGVAVSGAGVASSSTFSGTLVEPSLSTPEDITSSTTKTFVLNALGSITSCSASVGPLSCSDVTVSFQSSLIENLTGEFKIDFNGGHYVKIPYAYYSISQLTDLVPGGNDVSSSATTNPRFAVVDNELYFVSGSPAKLHRITTDLKLEKVSDIVSGATDNISELTALGSSLFFVGRLATATGETGNRLMKYSKASGFVNLGKINPTATSADTVLINRDSFNDGSNQVLMFHGKPSTATTDFRIFKVNEAGSVSPLTDTITKMRLSPTQNGVSYNNKFYFAAQNTVGTVLSKLYSIDTSGNIAKVSNINGAATDLVSFVTLHNGLVHFISGTALYRLNADGTIDQLLTQVMNAGASRPVSFNNALYLTAIDSSGLYKLFKISGNTVTKAADTYPGQSDDPKEFKVFDGSLFYVAAGNGARSIFRLDSNGKVTQMTGTGVDSPADLTVAGNRLFFTSLVETDDGAGGFVYLRKLFVLEKR